MNSHICSQKWTWSAPFACLLFLFLFSFSLSLPPCLPSPFLSLSFFLLFLEGVRKCQVSPAEFDWSTRSVPSHWRPVWGLVLSLGTPLSNSSSLLLISTLNTFMVFECLERACCSNIWFLVLGPPEGLRKTKHWGQNQVSMPHHVLS